MNKIALAATLLLAACAAPLEPVVPDYAQLRPGAFPGGEDGDVAAANLAVWAFSDSGRTYGRPIEGARAAAALEYMAGAFYVSPRWNNISALTKEELLQGRQDLRVAIGVRPGAKSQAIVDSLTTAANELARGNEGAAVDAFNASHIFLASGEDEVKIVSNLPYLRMANVSTQHASGELFHDDNRIFIP